MSSLFQAIPAEWQRTTLRHLAQGPKNGAWGSEAGEDEIDAICVRVADFDWSRLTLKLDDPTHRSFKKQQFKNLQLRRGDIVIEKSGGGEKTPVGRVVSFDENVEAVTSNFVARIRPHEGVWSRFFLYLLAAHYLSGYSHQFIKQNTGIQNLDDTNLFRSDVWVPDLGTQRKIADFLDHETARIDLLIERKQRLVALLGEKLEDDILRAVTLGIDADAELVPEDELEWTSHRPRDWNVFRLKHFFRENTQYSSDGHETLFSLRMKEGLVPHNDVSDKEILPSDLINYKKVFPGQIVMNRMRAAIGLFGLADSAGIVSPDYSIFDVHPNSHAAYFLRLFKTEPMMAAFRLLSKGLGTGHSGFMRLNADNFGRIRVAVPEYEEQRLISDYVEERIAQITHLQNKNDQSINRLKEYRTALITAAVTGQIDVSIYAKFGTPNRRLDTIQEEIGSD